MATSCKSDRESGRLFVDIPSHHILNQNSGEKSQEKFRKSRATLLDLGNGAGSVGFPSQPQDAVPHFLAGSGFGA